jgi:hypothetical protein
MGSIDASGYRGWWPLRRFVGKDHRGRPVGQEVFRNMLTGDVHEPANGWDGEPPYPTGDLGCVKTASDQYREGWERIFGGANASRE